VAVVRTPQGVAARRGVLLTLAMREHVCGKALPADLDRERPVACRHEARRDKRTRGKPDQHDAGNERSPATCAEVQAHACRFIFRAGILPAKTQQRWPPDTASGKRCVALSRLRLRDGGTDDDRSQEPWFRRQCPSDAVERSAVRWMMIPVTIDEELIGIARRLPEDWHELPAPASTREFGTRWVMQARSSVLQVPSIVVDGEFNYVLNPRHADFGKLRIGAPISFSFDRRL
jgi:RES domain